MPAEAAIDLALAEQAPTHPIDAPVVIEARGIEKTFRIPENRIDSFKERAVHPFARPEYRLLPALHDISFDIRKGEFFGIVGRNGSGKSTLLKILASIYRADSGSIRMSGRVAPFIELGVGFNQDLTARENVTLNGVMMGLSRKEAARRLDSVLEFAELEEFVDLKLKNYSSGMMVRLAFSVMIQADADIMLIDEVLAVGDAAFAQKCSDFFHDMRDAGRTIVLVTHDMGAVESFCHRAMLLHDGKLTHIGDPEDVGRRYLRLNFRGRDSEGTEQEQRGIPDRHAELVDVWLEGADGERTTTLEMGDPIRLRAEIEARRDLDEPVFGFHFNNADHVKIFGFNRPYETGDQPNILRAGERARIDAKVENRLTPGRYSVYCVVTRHRSRGSIALQAMPALDFVIFGLTKESGIVSLPAEMDVTPIEPEQR